jgi:hypothetical protein
MGLSVEDQLAIQQLYARYNHAIDAGKGDAWAACFTPDGTFKSGPIDLGGTAKLAEFGTAFPTRLKARHWTNNLVVEPAEGGAKGSCYLMLLRLTPGEQPPAGMVTTAIYNDTLAKVGGEWKFTSRAVAGDA